MITALVLVPGVFVAAELIVRGVTLPVPPPLLWVDYVVQHKVAQMRELANGPGTDVVFVGASTCMVGIDPEIAVPHRRAYNCGFNRGLAGASRMWMAEVLPTLRPRTVVLAVCAGELSDTGPGHADMRRRFADAARRRARHESGHPTRRALRRLALVSRRRELAHPWALASRWRGLLTKGFRSRADFVAADSLRGDGFGTESLDRSYKETPGKTAYLVEYIFDDYTTGGATTEEYGLLADEIRATGARLLVTFTPVPAPYFELVGGRDAHDRAVKVAREVFEDRGIPVLDCSDLLSDLDDFADQVHVNRSGMETYSRVVGAWLREEGAT